MISRFLAEHAPEGSRSARSSTAAGAATSAHELRSRGMQVVAVDSSQPMIDTARRAYGERVEFLVGDAQTAGALAQFDAVTSIMVLQFVEDVEATIGLLAGVCPPGWGPRLRRLQPGLRRRAHRSGAGLPRVRFGHDPDAGLTELNGQTRVPTFIRSADHYNRLCRSFGLSLLLEMYPPFTAEFLARFPQTTPATNAEYLILGYRKQAAPDPDS